MELNWRVNIIGKQGLLHPICNQYPNILVQLANDNYITVYKPSTTFYYSINTAQYICASLVRISCYNYNYENE